MVEQCLSVPSDVPLAFKHMVADHLWYKHHNNKKKVKKVGGSTAFFHRH